MLAAGNTYPYSCRPEDVLKSIEKDRENYFFVDVQSRGEYPVYALKMFERKGMSLIGISPDGNLVETVEFSDRDFFVGVQYHPEFKSRPDRPHPLFSGFMKAALKKKC